MESWAIILEKAWDKGAWCVIAVALLVGIHRAWSWLKPFLERAFEAGIGLVTSLDATTQQQAAANTEHAAANAKHAATNAEVAKALKQLLDRPACQATGKHHGKSAANAVGSPLPAA